MLLHRLQTGEWKVDDYRETILQGLLGGGMSAAEARKLVKTWVDDRPAKESILPAQSILMAFWVGAPQPKKANAPKKKAPETEQDGSTSARSMASGELSDTPPEK